jgi:hypothetical protein
VADSRTIAIGACGVSAGIHAALFAVHMRELPVVSAGFLTASLLLALTALVLALRPELPLGPAAAAALFAALLAAYPLFRHEPMDFLAVASKLVEAVGLGASLRLLRVDAATPVPGLSAVFLLCAALGLMLGGGHHAG